MSTSRSVSEQEEQLHQAEQITNVCANEDHIANLAACHVARCLSVGRHAMGKTEQRVRALEQSGQRVHDAAVDEPPLVAASQGLSGHQAPAAPALAEPRELGRICVGNLGWDMAAAELLERCRSVLGHAQVEYMAFDVAVGRSKRGSACRRR